MAYSSPSSARGDRGPWRRLCRAPAAGMQHPFSSFASGVCSVRGVWLVRGVCSARSRENFYAGEVRLWGYAGYTRRCSAYFVNDFYTFIFSLRDVFLVWCSHR